MPNLQVHAHVYKKDRIHGGIYSGTPALTLGEVTLYFMEPEALRRTIEELNGLRVQVEDVAVPDPQLQEVQQLTGPIC